MTKIPVSDPKSCKFNTPTLRKNQLQKCMWWLSKILKPFQRNWELQLTEDAKKRRKNGQNYHSAQANKENWRKSKLQVRYCWGQGGHCTQKSLGLCPKILTPFPFKELFPHPASNLSEDLTSWSGIHKCVCFVLSLRHQCILTFLRF